MILPAVLEAAALQALTRFPFLLGEVGVEEQDFGDDSRRTYFAALRDTRHFLKNGAASALEVGSRAGLGRDWTTRELAVTFTVPEQARDAVRALRVFAVGERFAMELRERLGKLRGMELLQCVAALAREAAGRVDGTAAVTDMEAVALAFIEAQRRLQATGERVGQPTGLYPLDRAIRGWRPGELTTLVASGGSGKSTLAEWWRRKLAARRIYTLKFAGEMTEEQEGERTAHAESGLPMGDDLNGITLEMAEQRIRDSGSLRYMRLCVRSRFEPAFLRGVIEGEKTERGGLGLVILDHLRHLNVATRGRSDYEIVSAAIEEAKSIAKDCSVPFLLVTHTNRGADLEARKNGGGDPDPSMIRGSGRIFEESDNVLCLWRPQQLASLFVWKARQTGVKDMKIQLSYDVRTQDYGEV